MRFQVLFVAATLVLVSNFGWIAGGADSAETKPASADAASTAKPSFSAEVSPLLTTYCVGCHSGEKPPGDVVLQFKDESEARSRAANDMEFWGKVVDELVSKEMPPTRAKRWPTDAERKLLVDWINRDILAAANAGEPNPGPYCVRRLNNREYANTVRDLLYLPADWNAAADFPADERGDGFDTNSDTLTLSPVLVEHYLDAAEKSVGYAFNQNGKDIRRDNTLASRSKLNAPSANFKEDFADRQAKVRLNIEVFAPRAYRRPVSKEEIDGLMRFAALSFTHDGESFDKASGLAMRAALMSPEFLFRLERNPDPNGAGKVFEITEFQLATRLSYFLWSSMPDDELYGCAKAGKLRENLAAQIARMLKDPKAISLTKDFLGQWLEIRSLGQTPNCPPELLAAMLGETEHFFNYIIQEDRSIIDFLDADYTFVNEKLAEHYGIPDVTGDEFQRVDIDPDVRGGIFTQASFLTLTSKPLGTSRRTSPVNRGKWILENIFNQKLPPPPPNVPSLAIDDGHELTGTVRQVFEQHRADPKCAECHARMDPYGFALENYDGFGAWRNQDNHVDVDASGEINGQPFKTPREFRAILASRREEFRRAFVQKLLSYSLGRGIQNYDRPAVDAICAAVAADENRFSSVILNIAKSYPFQHARASAAERPKQEAPAVSTAHE
jgi:Protein of unknown function (DUF1592)/Protein of unknown function (DUF1588)/Protein of unknown function (DUF1585)/Protein of unknown function (DUF1587)/Protein of unknown function (DUF1595)